MLFLELLFRVSVINVKVTYSPLKMSELHSIYSVLVRFKKFTRMLMIFLIQSIKDRCVDKFTYIEYSLEFPCCDKQRLGSLT
jgi:hypothetical protein